MSIKSLKFKNNHFVILCFPQLADTKVSFCPGKVKIPLKIFVLKKQALYRQILYSIHIKTNNFKTNLIIN